MEEVGGKDLESQALLRKVDVNVRAGVASEQLASSKREED